jgi:hypothetical protein
MSKKRIFKGPTASSVGLVNFTSAKVYRHGIIAGSNILVVKGTKPYQNMTVSLSPLTYAEQPDYWGIEVIGALSGFGLLSSAPYTVSLPLDGVMGKKGVEVIGANKKSKISIPEVTPLGKLKRLIPGVAPLG